ncbi:hypothetical protein IJG28_01380 [Candidatus Saccharibacteria bacterium]|nr:hypothetical protein [Candidatus Saccharibacteria bacterium]
MEKLTLPSKVVDSDWKDDIDFEPYKDEADYIQPDKVEGKTAAQAKKRNIKIGHVAIFAKDETTLA